jgi:hypothetical protein
VCTSTGFPFRCSSCAIAVLGQIVGERKKPETVIVEVRSFASKGIHHSALHDDALLFEPEQDILPIRESLKSGRIMVNLHYFDGLHLFCINKKVANAIYSAIFVVALLSLERADHSRQVATGGTVSTEQLLQAAAAVREAGYRNGQYAACVLMGVPANTWVK